MSRSPLAYPLTRGVDGDAGGAADLQTDIMRFMAILSLCLVAIFALVQSLPMMPEPSPPAAEVEAAEPETMVAAPAPVEPAPEPVTPRNPIRQVSRPPEPVVRQPPTPAPTVAEPRPAAPAPAVEQTEPEPSPPAQVGFTLRFASDHALTRLVARGDVGFYALGDGRALRLSVRESRLHFWNASVPGAVHEMETGTVPRSVIDAYRRTESATNSVRWGVTLPGPLKRRLDALMRDNDGGELVIAADGSLKLETS